MKRACLSLCMAVASTIAVRGDAQPAMPPPSAPAGPLAAGVAAASRADYPAAEKALASVQGGDRPQALLALGRVMLEQGHFAEAERDAVAAKGGATEDVRLGALALRGEILAAQGNVDEAIRLLTPGASAAGTGARRVRLELGEMLIRAGRRADAEPILLKFADEYGSDAIASTDAEGLAMVGRAMHLLRHPKDANTAYNESERAEVNTSGGSLHGSARVQTLLWRADLYIDKYDPGHAEQVLTEALKLAPRSADANVALARVKLQEALDFDAAEKLARDALAVNAKHAGAFAVRAGIALRDMDLPAASTAVEAGLAIDPNDLELLSLRAATRFLADDRPGFDAAKREVFARNKEYSEAYTTIAEFADWEHRYDDVVAMMKDAVALDPRDSKAWAQLGLTQTRAGDETDGVQSLEQAWRGDHFNVRVYNTLELLYGRWIPQDYDSGQEGIFRIRYPKDEKAVLERYVPRMLGEAWGAMKMHYMFAPAAPVAIEMYLNREHFSVRTSGLPNIGIEGVCFGHVVAAMSPRSEPFNWGNVLWHELAHVFAIQLSKYHVPRWFTEGLSEYETMIRRPEWHRELDPQLYLALRRKSLPGALAMNTAFTHAEGDLDVTVAYYAASQMLAFTATEFGFPRITRALEAWGEGKTTAQVIKDAFGVTADEYDARYRAWEARKLARYQGQYLFDVRAGSEQEARGAAAAAPQDPAAHVAYALALLRAKKPDEAKHEVDEALRLDPANLDARFMAYKLAALARDVDGEEKQLRALRVAGGDGYAVEMALAGAADARHDAAAARAALEAAHRFDPTQADPIRALYDMAAAEKRDANALDALREIARLDQHDRRAYKLLLGTLVDTARWAEARQVGESAIYVDVENAQVHVDYARALAATGDHDAAAYELESALLCEQKPPERANALLLLAAERLALGDAPGARVRRDEALKLDPDNAAAKRLKIN
jgi:cellulose synthase operon protein C